MKTLIAASLFAFVAGCTTEETYNVSLRYHAGNVGPVSQLYVDHDENFLLASSGDRLRSATIERIGPNGSVDWKYVPQGDEPAETATIAIVDLFQNAENFYVACTNRYPAKRAGELSSTIHILSDHGIPISRSGITPPVNEYKGNVLVEKCLEVNGRTFILGTIYGGLSFDKTTYPGTIYWLRTIDKVHNTTKDFMFSSNMKERAHVTNSTMVDGKFLFVARNGVFGELVMVDLDTGDIAQRRVNSEARLVLDNNRISIVSMENGRIEVNHFDSTLKPTSTASIESDQDSYFIAAYAPETGQIAIVTALIGFRTSTLSLIEANNESGTLSNAWSHRWAPAAMLSTASAKDSKGRRVFHFTQFHEHEKRLDRAFLMLEKR